MKKTILFMLVAIMAFASACAPNQNETTPQNPEEDAFLAALPETSEPEDKEPIPDKISDFYRVLAERKTGHYENDPVERDRAADELNEEEIENMLAIQMRDILGINISDYKLDFVKKFYTTDAGNGFWSLRTKGDWREKGIRIMSVDLDAKSGLILGLDIEYDTDALDRDALNNILTKYADKVNDILGGGFSYSDNFAYHERPGVFEKDGKKVNETFGMAYLFSDDGQYRFSIENCSNKFEDGTTYDGKYSNNYLELHLFNFPYPDAINFCYDKIESIPIDDSTAANCGLTESEALSILENDIGNICDANLLPIDINDYEIRSNGYIRLVSVLTMQSVWDFELVDKSSGKTAYVRVDPEKKKIINITVDASYREYTPEELQDITSDFLVYLGYEPLIRKELASMPEYTFSGQNFYDNYWKKYPETYDTGGWGVYAAQNAEGMLSVYFTTSYINLYDWYKGI